MKIYYLSASTVPSRDANSVHVMEMCQAFARNGHQVSLFGHCSTRNFEYIFDYYGVTRSFNLEVSADPMIRRLRGVSRLAHVSAVLKKMPPPDIFYSRDEWSLALAARSGKPFVLEAHAPPSSHLRHMITERLLRSPNMVRVIAISNALAVEFRALFPALKSEKIVVAPDSANIPTGQTRPVLLWPGREHAIQVGYVGSLYNGRGVDLISQMAERLPDIDFHVVGGKESLVTRWQDSAQLPNLKFHGHVPHKVVPSYFARFDILVAPYQPDVSLTNGLSTGKWMSPLKAFEYMTSKKPIVISDLPVLREIFNDGEDALMVRHDDINAWTQTVDRLRNDPDLRRRLGEMAIENVRNHSWPDRAKLVLSGLN